MTWIAASSLVLIAALVVGFAWYERTHPSSRVLALVATLAALAALGRIAFAPLPNVKPTTDIVLIAGFVLGGAPGFVVGAVAALSSNLFFGQGPWTPWQMVAWGLVGVAGAVLARATHRRLGRVPMAIACGVAGFAFGAIMNLHLWVTYSGDHTTEKLIAVFATSFPFDVAHAAGNVIFCLAFGPALVRALERYRARMDVTWVPLPVRAGARGPAALGILVVAAIAAAVATVPAPARAETADAAAAKASLSYLLKAQNRDGGWGGAPGQSSSGLYSGWAALGLAAAGRNPRDTGAIDYTRAHANDVNDLGEVSRTILLFRAAGLKPRVGGRDLVAALLSKRRPNGSFANRVNTTAFAAMALKAAGRSPRSGALRGAGRWIAGQANPDGGFNFSGRGGASGIDDTGAAIQGLVAAGRKGTKTVRRAAKFLARNQNPDGGYPLQPGADSNAQSTAWAIQGFIAAGRDPANVRHDGSRDPLAYLRSLTSPSGEVRYSRTSRQTPVWVTAQAVMALARKALPFKPVRRARSAAAAAAPAPTATPAPTAAAAPSAAPKATSGGTSAPAKGTPVKRAATKKPTATEAVAAATPAPVAAIAAAAAQPARARQAGYLAGLAVSALL